MCNIVKGLTKACNYSVGGNTTEVYIANASTVTAVIGGNGMVSEITGSFYKFEVAKDSLIDSATYTVAAAQNRFWQQTVSFKAAQSDNDTKSVMEDLGLARVVAVVKDKNGAFKLYGDGIGLDVTEMVFNSGGAPADEFGWTVTAGEAFTKPLSILTGSLTPSGSATYVFV